MTIDSQHQVSLFDPCSRACQGVKFLSKIIPNVDLNEVGAPSMERRYTYRALSHFNAPSYGAVVLKGSKQGGCFQYTHMSTESAVLVSPLNNSHFVCHVLICIRYLRYDCEYVHIFKVYIMIPMI